MNNLIKSVIVSTTFDAIENTHEFKFIADRIKGRAGLGYNYVKIEDDEELIRCLYSFSIKDYLQYLGFSVSKTIIKWNFKND